MRSLRPLLFLALLGFVGAPLSAQQRPRPQYQCGAQPALDSITTTGSRWLSCDHQYWSSVYRAAKMLHRYSGIDANCLEQYSAVYREAADKFLAGAWSEANLAKGQLTCAAGHQVRIDTESISMLCTNARWTPENAGQVNCPDPLAQTEQVNVTGWSNEVVDGLELMVRNNSPARTIRIKEWTVFDCIGVRGSICGRHTEPVILGPGQSTDLGKVQKDSQMGGFQYRWSWVAEFVE